MDKDKVYKIGIVVSLLDEEYQRETVKGIIEYAKQANEHINIACFVSFGGVTSDMEHDIGEYAIFDLINYEEFDGLILLTNTIQSQFVAEEITRKARNNNVPIVSIDYNLGQNTYYVGVSNYKAMYNMIEHLIIDHKCKTLNFVSGSASNVDAVARFNAYIDVLIKHNIPIEKERIYEGFFRGIDGKNAVDAFIANKENIPMPDAIVFANDTMALSGTNALIHNDYRVPEDIKTTGFDNIYQASNFAPRITSVKRPLQGAGYNACKIIMEHALGNKPYHNNILDTSLFLAESCGCASNTHSKKDIEKFISDTQEYKRLNLDIFETYNRNIPLNSRMSIDLIEQSTFERMLESLKKYVQDTKSEKFYLCLCDDWLTRDKKSNRSVNKLTDNLIIPLSYSDKTFKINKEIKTVKMLPDLHKRGNKGDIYIFSPVHYQNKTFGYSVLCNSDFALTNPLYHSWVMNISLALENLIKIESIESISRNYQRLYVTDILTGIYNRNGFGEYTKESLIECAENETPILILFSDMDGLKRVNDTYGHNEGDCAIQAIACALKKSCGNNEICARFGGDEFIVYGENYTESMVEEFIQKFDKAIDEYNRCSCKPYKIKVSTGWHIEIPKKGVSIFTIAADADKKMYEVKKKRKASKYLRPIN